MFNSVSPVANPTSSASALEDFSRPQFGGSIMSNVAIINTVDSKGVAIAKPVTLPAQFRKLQSISSALCLRKVLPAGLNDADTVKFSMFRLSVPLARTGLGGKSTVETFVQSLSALACAYAHGQGNVTELVKDLPLASQWAFERISDVIAKGKGIDYNGLVSAVDTVLESFLKLPHKLEKPAETVSTIGITVQSADVEEITATEPVIAQEKPEWTKTAGAVQALHDKAWMDYGDSLVNQAKAKEAAHEKESQEGRDVVRLIAEMADREQAVTLVRAMAARLGYTLVNMELPVRIAA